MKKYLVTGGDGFIGEKIAASVAGVSFDVKSGNDVLDLEKLGSAMKGAEGVFHCAAKISVPESIQKPEEYYENNVRGTMHVADAAASCGAKIVFSSSAAVYGNANDAVSEDALLQPMSPYAQNKLDGEVVLHQTELPSVILRYFNVYGPGQSDAYAGVISTFIKKALAHEDITIFGEGTQIRDFIYVDDVVRANIQAMNTSFERAEIFNIGTGTKTSILELVEMIIKLVGSSSNIKFQPRREGDIQFSQADITKATTLLAWHPQISLREGLEKTINFYRSV